MLFPTPKIRVVEMVSPERYVAGLEEPVIPEDATSGVAGRLPAYNAYSADGDVTADLVYVNQGIPADYEELERRGIDEAGKIVIARYGGSLARNQAQGSCRARCARDDPLLRPA